jgi:hypothetical protein
MSLCDLAQAQTELAIVKDGFAIEVKWFSSDLTAFESSTPHSGSHARRRSPRRQARC